PELSARSADRLLLFYDCVVAENDRQNLTRLVDPAAFWEGHVEDVKELLRAEILDNPAMDLGSGVGVPGLLAAALDDQRWVLAESEGRKAEFLRETAKKLGVGDHVEVFSGRGEEYLANNRVKSITARAVGP